MNNRQANKKIEQPPGGTNADLINILDILFSSEIIMRFPQHFLNGMSPGRFIWYIEQHRKTHPCYLHFTVDEFYPEISMESLFNFILGSYRMLCRENISVSWKNYLYNGLRSFFDRRVSGSAEEDKRLSVYLIPYVLLGLCSRLSPFPFLCTRREFLVFLPRVTDVGPCREKIKKELKLLGIKTTEEGIQWGSIVVFAGFQIEQKWIAVPYRQIDLFLSAIRQLTFPDRKYSSRESFIKQMNRRIQKFGHYYKYAPVRNLFSRLDKIILYYVGMYLLEPGNEIYAGAGDAGDYDGLCSLTTLYDGITKTKREDGKGRVLPLRTASFMGIEQFNSIDYANKQKVAVTFPYWYN